MSPAGDGGVVAGEEDFGDAHPAEFDGSGVVWKFKEARGEGIIGGGASVAEHSGQQTGDSVDDDDGSDDSIGEDVVADGDFLVDEGVDDALVDTLVVAAQQDEVRNRGGEALCGGVFKRGATGGEEDDTGMFRAQGFDGLEDGFAFEDHALAAAVGGVISGVVFVVGPISEVVGADGDEAPALGLSKDALSEGGRGNLGKEGEDVDEHGGGLGGELGGVGSSGEGGLKSGRSGRRALPVWLGDLASGSLH